jgi:molybdate transport system ATP-binding protein
LTGLEQPDRGFIRWRADAWFDAARRLSLPPQHRKVGYLAQDYALFPHLTVAHNVGYGLSKCTAGQRGRRVGELLNLLGLGGLEHRYPRQLSGGQQQRVALARAVANRPQLLLLDEPLSALDVPARELLRLELRHWLAAMSVPTLLVTHDRRETLALADTVVLMDQGTVRQSGPAQDVFARPSSVAAARIVGVENILAGEVACISKGFAKVKVWATHLAALTENVQAGKVFLSIRAEDVSLDWGGELRGDTPNRLAARITAIALEGPTVQVMLDCGFPLIAVVMRQTWDELHLQPGDSVIAAIKVPAVHLIAPS